MKKILVIFGTRPEAIKMCPVVKSIKASHGLQAVVCVTAQHREMLDQVLEAFDVVPEYDLNIMQPNQTLSGITTRALLGLEEVLIKEKPDLVLVHGDTTTAFVGALAAFYQQIPVGHVEAGLRTFNIYEPFPEEANRQFVDVISDFYFAPTDVSKNNLVAENKNSSKIYVTGNTVIDALKTTVKENYQHEIFDWIGDDKLILLTAHRRENLGKNLENIFTAIQRITNDFDNIKVVYPVHLNPIIQKMATEVLGSNEKVKLISPLDVIDFHNFMNKANIILTDSGGVQEEAPSLGVPVLVLRNVTERPEGIDAGTLKLVGVETDNIYQSVKDLLTNENLYSAMSNASNPYGDGFASEKIVEIINEKL